MDDPRLETEVAALREELARLNQHNILRSHRTTGRVLAFNFLRGLAFGLGSVVGATVLVSMLVYALSHIDFIPVIGEWAKEVIAVIQGG